MKRRALFVLAVMVAAVLLASGVGLAQSPPNKQQTPSGEEEQTGSDPSRSSTSEEEDFAPGRILVKFKKDASKAKKQEVHEKKGGKTKEVIDGIDVEVVTVTEGQEKSKAKEYQNDPNVKYAEVDGVVEALQTNGPNDPRAKEQWQFNNTKYTTTNQGDIDAYEAWNYGGSGGAIGSNSVPIAVLDTGIKENHEDFKDPSSNTSTVTKRRNFTTSSTNDDVRGHGTHVAGSAAAVTDNGKGVAGTCPRCSLYNGKVLGDAGSGFTSWVSSGITWAADNGAKVINMSLGSSSFSSTQQDAVNYAWNKGVVVVAAAGNSGTNTQFYPAAYPNVIAVAATDSNDAKASFSTYGSTWVDVAAPGANVLSTTVDGAYGLKSGTSMASPHVAGLAGLVWSKTDSSGNQLYTNNASVRSQVESKADWISGTGTYWAKGRINANNGVGTGTPTPAPDPTSPPPPPPGSGEIDCAAQTPPNCYGTNSPETIKGTKNLDKIYAYSGSDTVNADEGDDYVSGSYGDDKLNGDAGNDTLEGNSDNDTIDGGDGADTIKGSTGKDTITGGDGSDTVESGTNDDTIYVAGDGEIDTVDCSTGNDTVIADKNDTVESNCENVTKV
jgi:thermitase